MEVSYHETKFPSEIRKRFVAFYKAVTDEEPVPDQYEVPEGKWFDRYEVHELIRQPDKCAFGLSAGIEKLETVNG